MTTPRIKNAVKYHLPFALFGAAILVVSSIPNLKTPQAGTWPLDKVAHLLEYAIFAILTYRSSIRWRSWRRPGTALWIALLIPAGWALIDEWLQSYTPGRFSEWQDFVADVGGVVLVVGTVWLRQYRENRSKT
jgi:VanZ family protein